MTTRGINEKDLVFFCDDEVGVVVVVVWRTAQSSDLCPRAAAPIGVPPRKMIASCPIQGPQLLCRSQRIIAVLLSQVLDGGRPVEVVAESLVLWGVVWGVQGVGSVKDTSLK